MKNYFKKFSIMFVMSLVLTLGFCVSAFAVDEGFVGTANLNNTTENSAQVGKQLTAPEKGWKRYDDSCNDINYYNNFGTWSNSVDAEAYHGTDSYVPSSSNINTKSGKIEIKFYGTKIRIITLCANNSKYDSNAKVSIDGKEIRSIDLVKASGGYYFSTLSFEQIGMPWGVHILDIDVSAGKFFHLDAIDIDDTGYLVGNSESILLDKSTMDLNVGDSGQLTATTTPAAVGVTWTSSDPSIATIEVDTTNGKIVKVNAFKEGTCTIIATTADGSNLSASCTINVTKKTEPIPTPDPQPTDTDYITNIAHAKGVNTNNPGGEVTIIFHGTADTILSLVKTADVKDVWIGDNFTYTLVITNTGTKTAKAVVVNDPAPNHIDFNVSGVTTTQGTVDSSSTSKNIIVNVGDILPGGTVTIKIPSTVIA